MKTHLRILMLTGTNLIWLCVIVLSDNARYQLMGALALVLGSLPHRILCLFSTDWRLEYRDSLIAATPMIVLCFVGVDWDALVIGFHETELRAWLFFAGYQVLLTCVRELTDKAYFVSCAAQPEGSLLMEADLDQRSEVPSQRELRSNANSPEECLPEQNRPRPRDPWAKLKEDTVPYAELRQIGDGLNALRWDVVSDQRRLFINRRGYDSWQVAAEADCLECESSESGDARNSELH